MRISFAGRGRRVNRITAVSILLLAAVLEAAGDALMRAGLSAAVSWRRYALFAIAAAVLFIYGWTVNAPPWNFGRLLGLYVVFFFTVAQCISWIFFKQPPSSPILIGGAFILVGGLVIALN
jgi:drug/metabolite transporter (DMT)-like permease